MLGTITFSKTTYNRPWAVGCEVDRNKVSWHPSWNYMNFIPIERETFTCSNSTTPHLGELHKWKKFSSKVCLLDLGAHLESAILSFFSARYNNTRTIRLQYNVIPVRGPQIKIWQWDDQTTNGVRLSEKCKNFARRMILWKENQVSFFECIILNLELFMQCLC